MPSHPNCGVVFKPPLASETRIFVTWIRRCIKACAGVTECFTLHFLTSDHSLLMSNLNSAPDKGRCCQPMAQSFCERQVHVGRLLSYQSEVTADSLVHLSEALCSVLDLMFAQHSCCLVSDEESPKQLELILETICLLEDICHLTRSLPGLWVQNVFANSRAKSLSMGMVFLHLYSWRGCFEVSFHV